MPRLISLLGKTFGQWKVESRATNSKSKSARWNCRCSCGNTGIISGYSLTHNLSSKCFSCNNKLMRRPNAVYNRYWSFLVKGAVKRNIIIEITKEYALQLFYEQNQKCALTGIDIRFAETLKSHIDRKTTASLDRINPRLGYIHGNVQWIHRVINFSKGRLSNIEFLTLCAKIINFKHNPDIQTLPDLEWIDTALIAGAKDIVFNS